MNRPHLPPQMTSDMDVERIKARIRQQRFTLYDVERLRRWLTLFGALCGLLGSGCWFTFQALHYAATTSPTPSLSSFMGSTIQIVLIGVVAGTLGGFGMGRLLIGLWMFFRPLYVAPFYSPREFEQQYSEQPPEFR